MKLKNNNRGWTLLEILVVLLIVGVLAILALPRLSSSIEFSRSAEALNAMGHLKRAAVRCTLSIEAATGVTNDFDECDTFVETGAEDPGLAASSVFNYSMTAFADPTWSVVATRVGSVFDGDTITYAYDILSGITTRAGNPGGAYSNLK